MRIKPPLVCFLFASLLLAGCATPQPSGRGRLGGEPSEPGAVCRASDLSAEAKERILELNPEAVTEKEVRELLSQAQAPRIINIHGGLLPIKMRMTSFAQFLNGMGYPEASIRIPGNGTYTYGHYDSSDKIAGAIAWYYERDGLRPMIVGHSVGGIQAVRILHKLAGEFGKSLPVWNPLTESEEPRSEITDPFTGTTRPVVGLQVSYATAVVAGGMARMLPNEWDMNSKLREIPDTVEEFTGFYKGLDPLGGDFLGYGPSNDYHPMGKAIVRNVRLSSTTSHTTVTDTRDLLKNPEIKEWISNYRPNGEGVDGAEGEASSVSKSGQNLWAAEVWYGIKKHWVLELQRQIRAGLPQKQGE